MLTAMTDLSIQAMAVANSNTDTGTPSRLVKGNGMGSKWFLKGRMPRTEKRH